MVETDSYQPGHSAKYCSYQKWTSPYKGCCITIAFDNYKPVPILPAVPIIHSATLVPDNRARRQSGFPTFISCQRQDANVLPKRRQSHQGDKLCDVSTVPLVARWPVFWPADLTRTANPIIFRDAHAYCNRPGT